MTVLSNTLNRQSTFNGCKKLFKVSWTMKCSPPKAFYRGPALFHVFNDSVDVLTFVYYTKKWYGKYIEQ